MLPPEPSVRDRDGHITVKQFVEAQINRSVHIWIANQYACMSFDLENTEILHRPKGNSKSEYCVMVHKYL